MTEHAQLSALCAQLGADPAQAATMATQLLKRAEQIAAERGGSREDALKGLLEIVIKGRSGEVPARFLPPSARSG